MFYSTVGYQGWQQLTVYFKIAKILNILHTKTWQIFEVMDTVITVTICDGYTSMYWNDTPYLQNTYGNCISKKKVFLKINLKEMPISWLPTKEA